MTLVDPNRPLAHRRLALLPLPSATDLADEPVSAAEADYVAAFARFLSRNVAAGDPADDTRATYGVHVATWLAWCRGVELDVAVAATEDVEDYREALLGAGCLPSRIAIKLTLVRRLYDAAIRAGLRQSNPAAGVAGPRSKRAAEDFGYLSEGDLALLLRAVPERTDKHGHPRPIDLRDKALLALLSLQVLRTVEIWRSSVEDVQRRDDQWALLVRGKGHDRLIYLRVDVGEAVQRYLEHRDAVLPDARGVPLFAAVGNRTGRRRLSRRGVRTIVDGHLRKRFQSRERRDVIPHERFQPDVTCFGQERRCLRHRDRRTAHAAEPSRPVLPAGAGARPRHPASLAGQGSSAPADGRSLPRRSASRPSRSRPA